MLATSEQTKHYLDCFAELQAQLETAVLQGLPAMPDGTTISSLLQNGQQKLAAQIADFQEQTAQRFFDGLGSLATDGVDEKAIRLIALWRNHAHLVMTSSRCLSILALAQINYHENYGVGMALMASFTGGGRSYQAAEIAQRARCEKASADCNDAANAVAMNMRSLQMEAEQLVADLQARYPEF